MNPQVNSNTLLHLLLAPGLTAGAVAQTSQRAASQGAEPETIRRTNVFDSLGEAYNRANRRDDARKAYSRALQLDPANANARAKLQKLK
jgi:Flp pilus assembly protein TadD